MLSSPSHRTRRSLSPSSSSASSSRRPLSKIQEIEQAKLRLRQFQAIKKEYSPLSESLMYSVLSGNFDNPEYRLPDYIKATIQEGKAKAKRSTTAALFDALNRKYGVN